MRRFKETSSEASLVRERFMTVGAGSDYIMRYQELTGKSFRSLINYYYDKDERIPMIGACMRANHSVLKYLEENDFEYYRVMMHLDAPKDDENIKWYWESSLGKFYFIDEDGLKVLRK